MPLSPGTRLGPYEIVAAIGAGGMGEVYRARDTRLKRDVALKIPPESFASDPDRLARFQREAEVLASLNHPNIAAIHGLEESNGTRAIVMELVEGETLADRIARGPIPVDEALPIAKQIAEALEVAHEQGIVHRDLKPANIKVRPDGAVKVLDFGLAKLTEPSAGTAGNRNALSMSPTITTPVMTGVGVLLGTAAYMSPEQAKGKPADKRSDIWALGCVLYEMLAGQGPFTGEDVSDTLANVLKREPDWSALPKDVPAAVCILVQRCLAKDRLKRVSEISAAKFVLGELSQITSPPDPPTTVAAITASRWRRQTVGAVVVTAALAAIIVAAVVWALRPTTRPPAVARFSFALPGDQTFSGTTGEVVGVSPDGTRVAYSANSRIFLRSIDDPEPHAIAGTETGGLGLWNPIFAPDGRSLAYFSIESNTSATLKRIAVSGGAPSTVGSVGIPFGASWGTAGILIGRPEGVLRISPDGGIPERIISVAADEVAHRPQLLPDGRTVLFTVAKRAAGVDAFGTLTDDRWDKAQIVAQSTAGGARRVLIDGGSDARYVPTGHLVYAVGGTMFAVAFDVETLTVTGSPVPVVVGVARSAGAATGSALLALSDSGTLVYRRGPSSGSTSMRSLVIGDERGLMPLKIPPAQYSHPRASRDGKVLALSRSDGSQSDIWTYDLSGQSEIRRLTFGGGSRYPVWSADGRRLTFQSARDGDRAIYWQLADGTGAASRLTKPAQGEEHVPESWSPDGRHLLFSVTKEMTFSLWVLTLDGAKIEPFGRVQSSEPFGATFSPDGRWVAYASNDAPVGTQSPNRGVFIEPFPPTGEKHQAPKSVLDFHPVWTPDGRAILYVPSSARPIVRVPVATRRSVTFGASEELRGGPLPQLLSIDVRGYDVLQDGRFVSLARASDTGPTATSRPEIDIVLNWTEELKQRVPVK